MRFGIALLAFCVMASLPALALTDEEIFRNFRFNLIAPGARAMAMGGAFTALADDATAAQSNPAGLTILRRYELFAEFRFVDNGGTASILRETIPGGIDSFVATSTNLKDQGAPTFFSFVYPFRRWTLGVSRQQVLDTHNDTINRFAFRFDNPPGSFLVDGQGFVDIGVVNWNVSAGYTISDAWRVGFTVAYSTLDVHAVVTNTVVDTSGAVSGDEILEPTLDTQTRIDGSDASWGLNLGVLWKPVERLAFSAVYRRAPKFEVEERLDPQGLDLFGVRAHYGSSFANTVSIPDSFSLGSAWFVSDSFTFSQEFEFIGYHQLVRGYKPGVNILTDYDAKFEADNAIQYRAGAEYVQPWGATAIGLWRGGLWTEADSTVKAVSTGSNAFATPAAFPGRAPVVHGDVGLGIVWKKGQFKLDLAADFARPANQFLVSFIYRGR